MDEDILETVEENTALALPPQAEETNVNVAFVVPADVCDSIATDDETAIPENVIPVESPGPSAELVAIRELNEALMKRLADLQSAFDREVRAEATREKVVDRLHAELQEYKQDLLLNTLRPVFIDLIQLHDDIGKLVTSRQGAEGESSRFADDMRGFQQGIEDILYRQGVEPFEHDGEQFDPRRQRAASTIPTDDPSIAKTVASRLRKGFQAGEKLIRPEIISVYTLSK